MKASDIPTDTLPATLSDSHLKDLEEILSESLDGKNARLSKLRIDCQLEQIRRGGRRVDPLPILSDEEQEERERKITLGLRRYSAGYKLREVLFVEQCASRGRGKRKERTKDEQRDFNTAADYALGLPNGFLQRIGEQVKDRDHGAGFLRLAAEAWDAVFGTPKKETKITRHVRMALVAFLQLTEESNCLPTRWQVKEWVEDRDYDEPFDYGSNWDHVWKKSGLEYLALGTPRPVTKYKRSRQFNA